MFRRGLKDSVKDELIRDGRTNKDLDELIRTAIDLDDKLYERNMERRHDTRVRGSAGYVPRRSWTTKGNAPVDKGDPMELDVTYKVKKGSDQKGKSNPKKKREGLKCYACGKAGYIAKNCRSKNKVQRRQFNMTIGTGTIELGERIQLLRNLRNLLFARIRQEQVLGMKAREKGQFREADTHGEQVTELYDRILIINQRIEGLEKEVPTYEETYRETPPQGGHPRNESELGNKELNVTKRFDADQLPDDEDCEDSDTPEESEEEAPTANLEESSDSEESEEEEGEALASSAPVFRTKIRMNSDIDIYAIVDLGASRNFISKRLVDKYGIVTRKKKKGYELIAVDGSPLPDVDNETILFSMAIQRHREEVVLDVVEIARYDIVLGTP
ncbi:MAG: hypothetical protein FE78DRAFT_32883 [Acidomyces sp. 'richmondensis']|nr:MAG: hypothetical protein FE78DRAFT_32883 [Acidomyces sp. 'richmondensis']